MTTQEKLIARFLRQESSSKQIAAYHLRFAAKNRQGHLVETFDIIEALSGDELDLFAGRILARAQDHADGAGPGPSPYRYTISSVERVAGKDGEEGETRESSRMMFRVRANADLDLDDSDEGGEEAPTLKGLMTQLMRHNEAKDRAIMQIVGTMSASMGRREESQAATIEHLLEERTKMLAIVESAKTDDLERQLIAQAEERKQARLDFGIKKIALLAPTVMSYLTDGKMGGGADNPQTLLMKELIGSVTPEQIQVLMRVLQPAQQIAFAKLYESLTKSNGDEKGPNGAPVS